MTRVPWDDIDAELEDSAEILTAFLPLLEDLADSMERWINSPGFKKGMRDFTSFVKTLEEERRRRQKQEDGPTDDEIYNGPGVEGGIAYDTSADEPGSLGENDWRL